MLLVADVHGAWDELADVAAVGEPLLVLGDLINFIDYRTQDGILAEVFGKQFVSEVVALRAALDFEGARLRWRQASDGAGDDPRQAVQERVVQEYRRMAAALDGAEVYVTYGNVDWPELLREMLPDGARFVDGEVLEIEGLRVGFAGGGAPTPLGVPGEISEQDMIEKLERIGEVDVLCTHAAPAIDPLRRDVVAGRLEAGFDSLRRYLMEMGPRWHYFGDIHQPQAQRWRVGRTISRNVGYFRATGRAIRHG